MVKSESNDLFSRVLRQIHRSDGRPSCSNSVKRRIERKKNFVENFLRLFRMYQPIDYYLHLFNSLNGVLFPGGDFSEEYLYVAKLFYVWSLKVKRKKKETFFAFFSIDRLGI